VYHPYAPPTVSGTTITVDTMLNQPTRVTKMIMDLTLQRFIADRIFASAGGVTGGAVVYDKTQANELYAARDVEEVAPGAEFPEITDERLAPFVATVRKWGGKVYITDEARERNNSAQFTNRVRRLSNTIVRKLNAIAISLLEASIAASGRTVTGRNWATATPTGPDAGQTTAQNMPLRDFALANQMMEEDELGIEVGLWLLNPQEFTNLIIGHGGVSNLREVLSETNQQVYVSNRVTAGTAYALAAQQVGEMRIEKALGTATWREEGRQRTAVQTDVRPVHYVTNDFAVIKFTGLAG
jgi:hypothetical protein